MRGAVALRPALALRALSQRRPGDVEALALRAHVVLEEALPNGGDRIEQRPERLLQPLPRGTQRAGGLGRALQGDGDGRHYQSSRVESVSPASAATFVARTAGVETSTAGAPARPRSAAPRATAWSHRVASV